ncbi:hypothetical protein DSO57_1020260 [Entomophthora muscae]|uniref:Uncharacterized protein n=1 Tax=Entomophthora muscae TaxID=34485 RepID=A0ACC2UQU8_9FUNG|nr:hypothetical protein DSO57_1020260 [Entomophthora muscae]
MELSITPKPMPVSAPELPLDHTNKLFGIVYITLTGVIDTIILAASMWSWVGKDQSCGEPCLQSLRPVRSQKMMGQPPKVGSLKQTIILTSAPVSLLLLSFYLPALLPMFFVDIQSKKI